MPGANSAYEPPTWYVSASHKESLSASHRPFGTRHAREAGSAFAACGAGALGWQMFWAEPFRPDMPDVCDRCADVVIGRMRRARLVARGAHLGSAST